MVFHYENSAGFTSRESETARSYRISIFERSTQTVVVAMPEALGWYVLEIITVQLGFFFFIALLSYS